MADGDRTRLTGPPAPLPTLGGERLTARGVKRGLGTNVVGRRMRCYDSVASTMDTARRLAERGATEGAVVLAERQSRGRGRYARPWVSPPGANLTLSVILRPTPERLPRVTMAACVAVVDAIERTTGLRATVKWPNDVRIGGRKVAGILTEARSSVDATPSADGAMGAAAGGGYAIVGVGLNVNDDPTPRLTPPAVATSLAAQLGRPVERLPVLQALLRALDALTSPDADVDALFARWRGALDTLGRRVRVAWGGAVGDGARAAAEGVAVDVAPDGALILRRDDGSTVSLNAGEVTVLGEGAAA